MTVRNADTCTWFSPPCNLSVREGGSASVELEKVSPKRVAMPLGRHRPWSTSRCQDFSILSCSAVREAERRGHAGISVLNKSSAREERGSVSCRLSNGMLLTAGTTEGVGKLGAGVRERTRSSQVLTSRRSLVLRAGDKERKSHHS